MTNHNDPKFEIENFQGGAVEKPRDVKDYHFGYLIAVGSVSAITDKEWDDGFDSETEVGVKLVHENQNGSSSCVAQTTQKVGEGLNFIETGELLDFSAKRIYENIRLDGGGAYVASGAEFAINNGFMLESDCPSYENGQPPSEAYMAKKGTYTKEQLDREKNYKSLRYFYCYSIDEVAAAIKSQKFIIMAAEGENSGWRTADLIPPAITRWGHAFMGKGFCRRLNPNSGKKEKAIRIHNSWGESWGDKGDGWLYESYFAAGKVMPAIALVDKNNLKTMGTTIKLVKTANKPDVYLVGSDGLYHPIISGKVALDLFGSSWEAMKIEIVDKIPQEKVSYTIGGVIS